MKINLKWVKRHEACSHGIEWFEDRYKKKDVAIEKVIEELHDLNEWSWVQWLVLDLVYHTKQFKVLQYCYSPDYFERYGGYDTIPNIELCLLEFYSALAYHMEKNK